MYISTSSIFVVLAIVVLFGFGNIRRTRRMINSEMELLEKTHTISIEERLSELDAKMKKNGK